MLGRASRVAYALLALFVGAVAAPTQRQSEPDVTLYMPALESEGMLGLRAATVLNLQIWQTLRRAPFPNPNNLSFGEGLVLWNRTSLNGGTHDIAATEGRAVRADLVLWGRAWEIGSGVVVQTYLTVIASEESRDVSGWQVSFTTENGQESLSVVLPRLRYEFAPIVLDAEVVQSFASPAGLQMVAEKNSKTEVGRVGPQFRALQNDGDDWIRVESQGVRGWVHLPELSERSEITDFVGGLIRILRADWTGATQLLARVTSNAAAPDGIKVDAQLLMALSAHHRGRDALAPIRQAYALNPHDVAVTRFECMEYVEQLAESGDPDVRRRARARLTEILDQRSYLYASDDPWFAKVRRAVDQVSR